MAQWKPKASKEVHKYPKSVQKSIPIKAVHPHGIFEHNGEFTMSGTFTDVNYQAASMEDQEYVFANQQELIKALEIDEHAKLTVINWPIHADTLAGDLFMQFKDDGLDEYREEFNRINMRRATEGTNSIRQQRYFTVNTRRKKIEDAKVWFNRMESTLKGAFSKMGSDYERLDTRERLRLFHDFFRYGEEQDFNLDIDLSRRRGHSVKDYIAPDGMEFQSGHFRIGKRYGRVLVLKEYPAYLRDIADHAFPDVVFHSLRALSSTYKLKLNKGDLKATQGDTGHTTTKVLLDTYARVIDEDRKNNAIKMENELYNKPDPSETNPTVGAQKLFEMLKDKPELAKAAEQFLTTLVNAAQPT